MDWEKVVDTLQGFSRQFSDLGDKERKRDHDAAHGYYVLKVMFAALTDSLKAGLQPTEELRMCVNCGRKRPASEGRETSHDECPSPEACTWDLTPDEAWQHWRKKYHELRGKQRTEEVAKSAASFQTHPIVRRYCEGFCGNGGCGAFKDCTGCEIALTFAAFISGGALNQPQPEPTNGDKLPNMRPDNCRHYLAATGQPYPRSSCTVCGSLLTPGWECPYGQIKKGF